ncbi:HDOD domain-containing protein [Syntrophobacteraceae bacterium DRH4]|nr:HDOD domain-containing protein [Desulfoferrobacter suflitae]
MSEVEQVVQYDPVIAARVLRVARSPYYGGSRVKTLRDAVIFLGQRTLCETILAACSMGYFKDLDAYNGTSAHRVWQHSIAVAVMSQTLATRLALRTALANFMAGLLHDFGKMVLNSYLRPHKEAFAQALASGLSMRQTEEMILGTDHAIVGGIIASSWKLPNVVIASIRHHHAPEEGGEFRRNAAVVCAADVIAMQAGYGYEGEWHTEKNHQWVLDDLKITPEGLAALVKQVKQAVKGAMTSFGENPANSAKTFSDLRGMPRS